MNSSFNYAKTLGGGSYSGLKQAILRPETGGILFTDDQLINEELNTEFRTFSNEYDVYNPLITNDAIINRKLSRIFSVNAGVDIDFLKDFTFRTAGSYNWAQIKTTNFDDGRTANAQLKGGPYGSIDNKERYAYQWTNTLNWKHTFEKHDLGVLLGHELYYTNTSGTETAYKAFPDTNFGLNDISMATPDTWKSSLEENALLSFSVVSIILLMTAIFLQQPYVQTVLLNLPRVIVGAIFLQQRQLGAFLKKDSGKIMLSEMLSIISN